MAQRKRGTFEVLIGSLGEFADAIHRRTGARLPWGVRLGIAIFWDAMNIALRIIAWPFYLLFPGLSHIVRAGLNTVLAFFGAILWGTPGLLQAGEALFGLVPGVGIIVDLMPMLTIAGFIYRRQKREAMAETAEPAAADALPAADERGIPMIEGLCGLAGALVWFTLWYTGVVAFGWIIILAPVGVAVGFAIRAMRWVEIPPRVFGISAAVVAGLIGLNLALLGVFWLFWPEESYRMRGWRELVAGRDSRVQIAQQLDTIGVAEFSKGVGGALGSVPGFIKEQAVSVFQEKKFRSPLFQGLRKRITGEQKPPPPAEEQKAVPQEMEAKWHREVAELKLGPMQARLYRSDYVLERGWQIREGKMGFFLTVAEVLGVALIGLGILSLVARRPRDYGDDDGDREPPFNIHDRMGRT